MDGLDLVTIKSSLHLLSFVSKLNTDIIRYKYVKIIPGSQIDHFIEQ